jgi:molybdopterin molybdotransferase
MLLASLPSGRWLVGLPGNPYAACVALLTLVQPLLAALQGALPGEPATVVIGSDEPGRVGDGHRLLPVRATGGVAEVLPSCGSAMLRGLAQASGLAVIPPEGAMSGAWVEHLPLPWQR